VKTGNGRQSGLRVVVLTGAGTRVVMPLIDNGFNVAGIAELVDSYAGLSTIDRIITSCYWYFYKFSAPPYLSRIARSRSIPYLSLRNRIDSRLEEWLRGLKPDILVVYASPLLPPEIFNVPVHGSINIHPSLLPNYRGANPIFWMHYHMDLNGGVTIHRIDEGVDSGDILAQTGFRIPLGASRNLVERMAIDTLGMPLLMETLRRIERGEKWSVKQGEAYFSGKCRRVSPEEFRNLVDWSTWEISRVWHVLSCTDYWETVYLPDHLRRSYRTWQIGAIDYSATFPPYGVVQRDSSGYYLNHKEGKIRIDYSISLKRLVKATLRK
jgi:folate-dependent phosphoribosylglycinamide formyltransferase PurN